MTDSLRRPEPGKPEPQAGVGGLAVVDPAKVEPDAQEMTPIVLRPIGSPLPLGFFTVAIDNVLVSTLQWGLLPNPTGAAAALGVFYVVIAVFISLMLTSAFLKRAIVAVLAVAAPRFLISGVAEITGSQAVSKAAAVLGFLLAAVALYTAFALLMEDSRGREVLPIGRFGAALQATHGTWPTSCATSSGSPASAGRYDVSQPGANDLPHSGLGASCQYTLTLESVFLYRPADHARPLPTGLEFTTGRVMTAPNALVDGGAVGAGVRCAGPGVRSGGPGVRCAGKAVSAAGVHPAMTQTAAKRTGINVNFTVTSF